MLWGQRGWQKIVYEFKSTFKVDDDVTSDPFMILLMIVSFNDGRCAPIGL